MAERVNLPEITSLTVSDRQARDIEKHIAEQASFDRRDGGADLDVSRAYNSLFLDFGTELARVDGVKRTSLIVDPPEGRIPPLTAEAERRRLASVTVPPWWISSAGVSRPRNSSGLALKP